MKLWQKKYATITDAVHALASRRNALPEDAIKHGLITAVWQGKFEGAMVLHVKASAKWGHWAGVKGATSGYLAWGSGRPSSGPVPRSARKKLT